MAYVIDVKMRLNKKMRLNIAELKEKGKLHPLVKKKKKRKPFSQRTFQDSYILLFFWDSVSEPELGSFSFSNGLFDPNLLFIFIIRVSFKTEPELPSWHKKQRTWGFWKLSKLTSYITSQPRSFKSNMGSSWVFW